MSKFSSYDALLTFDTSASERLKSYSESGKSVKSTATQQGIRVKCVSSEKRKRKDTNSEAMPNSAVKIHTENYRSCELPRLPNHRLEILERC